MIGPAGVLYGTIGTQPTQYGTDYCPPLYNTSYWGLGDIRIKGSSQLVAIECSRMPVCVSR